MTDDRKEPEPARAPAPRPPEPKVSPTRRDTPFRFERAVPDKSQQEKR
jgi:hypothetical protein